MVCTCNMLAASEHRGKCCLKVTICKWVVISVTRASTMLDVREANLMPHQQRVRLDHRESLYE